MEPTEIEAGDRLGRYELLVPLAQGGMAAVWAARSVDAPDRVVAVKMILAEMAEDEDSRSMLRDEARNVARIQHANVVEMLDVGEANDVLYLVMEWVDGEPLHVLARAAAKAGPMPIEIAVAIARQVAGGLHAAHELHDDHGAPLELVHRDVSPQNLLVGFDGVVKVVDFGVAKAPGNMHHTTVGQLKGKASFMAPEQTRGQPVDRRTDVFALGVVLYQLISGKHPFSGDNEFAVMLRIADPRQAAALSTVRADCPPELDQVVATALQKQKDARFSSMLEFSRALEAAVPRAPRSPVPVASFVQEHVGKRGNKRRDAIRSAIQLADSKQPNQRAEVDRMRIPLASERPPPSEVAPAEDASAASALEQPRGGAAPEAQASTTVSAADVRQFKSRLAPVLAMLVIAAVLGLAYLMLRD